MLIKLSNQHYPSTPDDVRAANPRTSFPSDLSGIDLTPFGFARVTPQAQPAHNTMTERVVEAQPELVNGAWEQRWIIEALSPDEVLSLAKGKRASDVSAILVTTQSGKEFDGDEESQTRMARAILVMQATSTPEIKWVLANNVPTMVTVAELVEALALAGSAQAAIWSTPYEGEPE